MFNCVLNSFSFASKVKKESIINFLGFDGSEIEEPNLTEPFCRRGHSLDDMVYALLREGLACVVIPKHATMFNCFMTDPKIFDGVDRVQVVNKTQKPVGCVYYNDQHCVATRGKDFYDPGGRVGSLEDFKYEGVVLIFKIV